MTASVRPRAAASLPAGAMQAWPAIAERLDQERREVLESAMNALGEEAGETSRAAACRFLIGHLVLASASGVQGSAA